MNLIEILKYANSGDILYSPIFGNVIFKELTYNLLTLSNLFYKGEISEKTL